MSCEKNSMRGQPRWKRKEGMKRGRKKGRREGKRRKERKKERERQGCFGFIGPASGCTTSCNKAQQSGNKAEKMKLHQPEIGKEKG